MTTKKIIFLYTVGFFLSAMTAHVQAQQNLQEKMKEAENSAITTNAVEIQQTPSIQYLGTAEDQVKGLEQFYKTEFGCDVDFSKVEIPEEKEGFGRLIIIAEEITCNEVFAALKRHFKCSGYFSDLDERLIHNDRKPNKSYAIWTRTKDKIKADNELQGEPSIDLKEKNINGITLLERLVWELLYFEETGKHLFLRDWTLCSGSRSNKRVPLVDWNVYHSTLRILWYDSTIIDMDLYPCPVVY